MECPNCHRMAPDDGANCTYCGAVLRVICQRCGGANAVGHEQCRLCGAKLRAAPRSPAWPEGAAPQAVVPPAGLTPFTGRGPELSTLLRALDAAAAGQGQWVTVTGEAGLGKSRLRLEFCQGLDGSRFRVMEGRCQAHTANTPYLPFVHAVRRSLEMDVLRPTAEYVGKVVDGVLRLDAGLAPHLPLILHLLSLSSAQHALPTGLAGEAYRLAMEAALQAYLTACARQRPT